MSKKLQLGWKEWVGLPDLNLQKIKAKVDTGAKTSCLHAFSLEKFNRNDEQWVRFGIHPHQGDTETEVFCEAKIVDERLVTDSGGHKENRYVITSDIIIGHHRWPIELTLTNRDSMQFRMLLGRRAMHDKIIVDPSLSYLQGKPGEV